jgi:hypothetical protein
MFMFQPVKKLLWVLLLSLGLKEASAFSLLGPLEAWQTTAIGYTVAGPFVSLPAVDIGGPMGLGDEYRWDTPTLVYGFDSTFLNFFGQQGVDAVERAIKMFNDLPAASQMSSDLSEFPLDTRRFNYRAAALGIVDLKSYALYAILEGVGLATPERYVYALRARTVLNNIPYYAVIKRNFDPVTLQPSSYVNGTLYTYSILAINNVPDWDAIEIAVDPLAPSVTSVMAFGALGLTDGRGNAALNAGLFYDGFTRDDIGGIRYLLNKGNLNVENLPAGAGNVTGGGGTLTSGSGGGSAWLPVPGSSTNAAAGGAGAAGGGATTTNALANTVLRPGVEKLTLIRADYDSVLGQFSTNSVLYSDTYLTNGTLRQQIVQRAITQPDIIFSAADLGINGQSGVPILISRTITFQNNSALNGIGTALAGPGNITGPFQVTFSKIGPYLINVREGNQVSATQGIVWGSYDGSTNAPIVFPSGLSIQALESVVLQQRGGGSPWRIP